MANSVNPKKLGSPSQLGGLKRIILDDGSERGVRAVDIDNGNGLFFRVLLDRGMDIGEARFHGKSLAWLSPCGFRHPGYFEHNNAEWLRNWGGGLLTSSGLRNIGAPNEFQGENLALHGRISNIPAQEISCMEEPLDGKVRITLKGTMREAKVFGENLILTRTIVCETGSDVIEIRDKVENQGFRPTHAGILYHINLGWPLVDSCAKLCCADHPVVPRNKTAEKGLLMWAECHEPEPGYIEQCFYHDLSEDKNGMAEISLENPDSNMKFTVSFRKKELPLLTQWKQFGEGEYVLGLEPGTSHVEGTKAEHEKYNSLKMLASGDSFETLLRIQVSHFKCF